MVLRLRLDNPISIPVATAVGITPFLKKNGHGKNRHCLRHNEHETYT